MLYARHPYSQLAFAAGDTPHRIVHPRRALPVSTSVHIAEVDDGGISAITWMTMLLVEGSMQGCALRKAAFVLFTAEPHDLSALRRTCVGTRLQCQICCPQNPVSQDQNGAALSRIA